MNKTIYGTGLVAICILSACASKKETGYDTTLPKTEPINNEGVSTGAPQPSGLPANTAIMPSNSQVQPSIQQVSAQPGVQQVNVEQPNVQQVTTQPAIATKPGMNPPHGQPNHRCEIGVGEPLSTPVKSAATQTITPSATPATVQTTSAKTVTAPGMNPPHGEPGHRCDIAVGESLKSPVKKTATPTVTPATPPAQVAPAAKDSGSR